jgi:hypothetical protein
MRENSKKNIEPLNAIMAFHNAFRRDMEIIDNAALASARAKKGLDSTVNRFRFFNEILVWHAKGEELAIFPALELVAPSVSEAYERDHHGLDAAYNILNDAVSNQDLLEVARATAAFKFHLDIHLGKEDAHLYRLVKERISALDRAKALGLMSTAIPSERFPDVIAWLFPLIGNDDRENMVRIWQMVMPPPVFVQIKELIQKSVGAAWSELEKRIPTPL